MKCQALFSCEFYSKINYIVRRWEKYYRGYDKTKHLRRSLKEILVFLGSTVGNMHDRSGCMKKFLNIVVIHDYAERFRPKCKEFSYTTVHLQKPSCDLDHRCVYTTGASCDLDHSSSAIASPWMRDDREGTNIQKNDLDHRCVCDVLVDNASKILNILLVDIDFDGKNIFLVFLLYILFHFL